MLSRLLVVCSVLAAGPVAAQTTRAEAIAEEQAKRAKTLGVEGPSRAERLVVRVISSPLLAARTGPYPWFGSVYPGSGFAAGAGYFNKLPWGGSVNVATGISINYSKIIDAQLELPELARGKFKVNAMVRRLDVKSVSFYGAGPQSTLAGRQRYDLQPDEVGVNAVFRPRPWFSASAGLSHLGVASVSAEKFAPGIGEHLTFNTSRASATIDWRPSLGYNTRGGMYRAEWDRRNESKDKPYDFRTTEYEVIQLVPFVREQFVFAFRALATLSHTDGPDQVPVMLEPYLGGGSTLRGFRNRRFTDRNRVLINAEYRWRPSRYLDMVLFYDAGQVAEHQKQFRFESLVHTWGTGFRLHGPTFTALRVEAAKGREGWVLVVASGQTF